MGLPRHAAKRIVKAARMLHGLCLGEEAGARNPVYPCVFPCEVAAGGDERYLVCGGCGCGRFAFSFLPHCNGGFKLPWVCLCVRSYRVFWNLWLQIAVEWLHDCCHVLLPCV